MTYVKKTWENGNILTANAINNIENGIFTY